MRMTGLTLAALLFAACGQGPVDPLGNEPDADAVANAVAVDTGEPFRIRAGTIVRVENTDLILGFRGVSEDSRCPIDVICVWQGDANVRILATMGRAEWTPLDLHTGIEPRAGTFQGFTITLVSLDPAPRSDQRIPPDDYVATLRVSR